MAKKKVAFICVHNSCRSQIAEALGKHLASDVFESYSAGTETKSQINWYISPCYLFFGFYYYETTICGNLLFCDIGN